MVKKMKIRAMKCERKSELFSQRLIRTHARRLDDETLQALLGQDDDDADSGDNDQGNDEDDEDIDEEDLEGAFALPLTSHPSTGI